MNETEGVQQRPSPAGMAVGWVIAALLIFLAQRDLRRRSPEAVRGPAEILELLKHNGVEVYSLFLDRESETVYAFQKIKKDINSQGLGHHEIIQKWWFYMSDIMECNLDHSPVSIKLDEIFYLE